MNLHVQGINKRKLLKKDSAQVVQEPPADQERWPWFLNALQELEQVDTAEKADQIASLTQAWLVPADVPLISLYKLSMFFVNLVVCSGPDTEVLFVPAGHIVLEKALVSHNYNFRVTCACFDGADSLARLRFSQQFFPLFLGRT